MRYLSRTSRIALAVAGFLTVALAVFAMLFDWNWLKGPIERQVSESTGRALRIEGDIDVDWGWPPIVKVGRLTYANPAWSAEPRMAAIEHLAFRPHLLPLLRREVVVQNVVARSPDVLLERLADGRRNWVFRKDGEGEGGGIEIRDLAIDRGVIRVRDAVKELNAHIQVASGNDDVRPTDIVFKGDYLKVPFDGKASVGSLLALRTADEPFPLRGKAVVGETRVEVDGQVANILRLEGIDARVKLSGPDWSRLYPVLPVALPRSPPYTLEGRLKNDGRRYAYEGFSGRIGGSDLSGTAVYLARDGDTRPRFTADFHSNVLDLKDLGPMVGLKTSGAPMRPAARGPRERIFPDEPFRVERMNTMDADVSLKAKQIRRPEALALEDLNARLKLEKGVMVVSPLDFGFAGGNIVSTVKLDARKEPIATDATINMRAVKLDQLFPTVELMKKSQGRMGAMVKVTGRGNSVASTLATADGQAGFAVSEGVLSNLLVEFMGLDGGEILKFLVAGDKETRIRCGAALFAIDDGIGTTQSFVFDTVDTKIEGAGAINLKGETLDLRLKPQPKDKSVLVLRTPIRITGTFSDPDVKLEKDGLLKRGGAAALLGALNPIAALLPLIERGGGKDADCEGLLAEVAPAAREAEKPVRKQRGKGVPTPRKVASR